MCACGLATVVPTRAPHGFNEFQNIEVPHLTVRKEAVDGIVLIFKDLNNRFQFHQHQEFKMLWLQIEQRQAPSCARGAEVDFVSLPGDCGVNGIDDLLGPRRLNKPEPGTAQLTMTFTC